MEGHKRSSTGLQGPSLCLLVLEQGNRLSRRSWGRVWGLEGHKWSSTGLQGPSLCLLVLEQGKVLLKWYIWQKLHLGEPEKPQYIKNEVIWDNSLLKLTENHFFFFKTWLKKGVSSIADHLEETLQQMSYF